LSFWLHFNFLFPFGRTMQWSLLFLDWLRWNYKVEHFRDFFKKTMFFWVVKLPISVRKWFFITENLNILGCSSSMCSPTDITVYKRDKPKPNEAQSFTQSKISKWKFCWNLGSWFEKDWHLNQISELHYMKQSDIFLVKFWGFDRKT